MKLTYLGTAAAEGWPSPFCTCEACTRARAAGGRNLRSRSQAIVNDDLLIDFPADTFAHTLATGLSLSGISHCIVTHSHQDHFTPLDLYYRYEGTFSHGLAAPTLHIYGNEAVLARYQALLPPPEDAKRTPACELHLAEAFTPFRAGRYEITPLPAHHAPKEKAFVYLIRDGEKTLLYLHDTGLPSEEFLAYLSENHVRADLITFDCTYVELPGQGNHLGLDTAVQFRDALRKIGVSQEGTVEVVNHFSHNGHLIYDDLVPVAKALGFLTSYDGMSVEF